MSDPQDQPNENGWTPCCSGELKRLASALRKCRCLNVLRKVATTTSVLVLCLLLGAFAAKSMFPQQFQHKYGGLTCAQVKELAPQVIAGKLEPSLQSQVDQHLAHCEGCREMIAHLRDEHRHQSPENEQHASLDRAILVQPIYPRPAALAW